MQMQQRNKSLTKRHLIFSLVTKVKDAKPELQFLATMRVTSVQNLPKQFSFTVSLLHTTPLTIPKHKFRRTESFISISVESDSR